MLLGAITGAAFGTSHRDSIELVRAEKATRLLESNGSGHGGAGRSGAEPHNVFARGKYPKSQVKIGTVRTWPATDYVRGIPDYPKDFTLRGVGQHVEVWVASGADAVSTGLEFPPGDCRNAVGTQVTDEQVRYLIGQFDGTIFPKESASFSTPPERDGKHATLPARVPKVPSSAFKGEGDNIVILVDNIRGDSFYDFDNVNRLGNTQGFFSARFTEMTDRNIVTVMGVDWPNRLGADPLEGPSDSCSDRPAKPHDIESILAHEYQHLLEYYEDPDEASWVDEGLAQWAETLTGYARPEGSLNDHDFDSNIQCFLGHAVGLDTQTRFFCPAGPENSLTVWGDQAAFAPKGIRADYGAAYTFMELLHSRYGDRAMTELHRQDANGLEGLQRVLDELDPGKRAVDLVHDWAAAVALDGVLDDGAELHGAQEALFSVPTLHATVNWDTPRAYDTPGAPPNGSDYVRLRDGAGEYVNAASIESISFDGASGLTRPMEWTVDPTGNDGGPALYSGSGDLLDRSIVRPVSVPTTNPVLSFGTRYSTESQWDFAFVQISSDGGRTYRSLPATPTTALADPQAHPTVLANLPGFTGESEGWVRETVDLSPYAGQTVLLAFRYVTDWSIALPGVWFDNIAVGDAMLSDGTTLEAWQTMSQVHPIPVAGWSVQLIGYTDDHRAAWVTRLPLDSANRGRLSGTDVDALLGTAAQTVAAVITYDEPTETLELYAPYRLMVNGVVQPGG
ncbi:MAG: peptidase M6 [Acidimicrobiales bacterium]